MMIEPAQPPFALFPEARHWWSLTDYGAVLGVMRAVQPKTVLEFGPGSSTLALIEGGAQHIDTLEDDPAWATVYRQRLEAIYRPVVHLLDYTWAEPLTVPGLLSSGYDLAFVDGPRDRAKRLPVVAFCLQRATAVLVPTEDDGHASAFLADLQAVAHQHGFGVMSRRTGPNAGGFALLARIADHPVKSAEAFFAPEAPAPKPRRGRRPKKGA